MALGTDSGVWAQVREQSLPQLSVLVLLQQVLLLTTAQVITNTTRRYMRYERKGYSHQSIH